MSSLPPLPSCHQPAQASSFIADHEADGGRVNAGGRGHTARRPPQEIPRGIPPEPAVPRTAPGTAGRHAAGPRRKRAPGSGSARLGGGGTWNGLNVVSARRALCRTGITAADMGLTGPFRAGAVTSRLIMVWCSVSSPRAGSLSRRHRCGNSNAPGALVLNSRTIMIMDLIHLKF